VGSVAALNRNVLFSDSLWYKNINTYPNYFVYRSSFYEDFDAEHNYVIVEITNTMHRFASLFYSIRWLLHIPAVVCHLQGASGSV
jgi:hypothetical protein